MVHNALAKGKKLKPKNVSEFHPWIKPTTGKTKITPKNIGILKQIGNALCTPGR
jgi:hypothetical protein